MLNLYRIGTSALLTFQKALGTTAHNVANVNTPAYSRQRVELSPQRPEFVGEGFIGNGVQANAVRRSYNRFVVEQVRTSQSAFHQQKTNMELAQQVENLLGDTETGLAAGLQDFFNSVQDVADEPTSTAARQVMLTEGESLVSRFHRLSQGLEEMGERIDGEIKATVDEINSLATSIADLNEDIEIALGLSSGQAPNDLFDQRDALLEELSQRVAVNIAPQDSGAVNVFVGSGHPLVVGNQATTLNATPLGQDNTRLGIIAETSNGSFPVTDQVTGGRLSGLLEARDKVLIPSQNALGRIAIGLSTEFNQQHQKGMDLNGALGQDFFEVPDLRVVADSGNAGVGTVLVDFGDISQLTTDDLQLSFNGTAWSLTRISDGQSVPFASGAGTVADPYGVNGLSIVVDSAAVAGDSYLIQPTRNGAAEIEVALSNSSTIAAGAALYTEAVNTNSGAAQISAAQVIDRSDPNLLDSATITFDNPAVSFSVDGGASIPFTSGDSINLNGWQIRITGNPGPGDTFTVSGNQLAVGDNSNVLQLGGLQQKLTLANGTASIDDAYSSILADVGAKTRQAQISTSAGEQRLEQAQADRESVSGVNLDEAAANLLRFQQAYQAAAQTIAVADTVFESLLNAVRR